MRTSVRDKSVPVTNEELAALGHGHAGRLAEVAVIRAGHESLADGQRRFFLAGCDLEYLMQCHVGNPDVIEGVHGQPVRHIEAIGAVFLQNIARFLVQDEMRVLLDGSLAG